jgi:hypothetical protein
MKKGTIITILTAAGVLVALIVLGKGRKPQPAKKRGTVIVDGIDTISEDEYARLRNPIATVEKKPLTAGKSPVVKNPMKLDLGKNPFKKPYLGK